MQLKNALIGAIVGGLIGIGVLVAAFMFFGTQHTALALVVAVLVGVGVRMMVATKGHTSYMRVRSRPWWRSWPSSAATSWLPRWRNRKSSPTPQRRGKPPCRCRWLKLLRRNRPPRRLNRPKRRSRRVRLWRRQRRGVRGSLKSAYTTWDVIWLSVAMLVAYEFGRGSGTSPTIVPPPAETA